MRISESVWYWVKNWASFENQTGGVWYWSFRPFDIFCFFSCIFNVGNLKFTPSTCMAISITVLSIRQGCLILVLKAVWYIQISLCLILVQKYGFEKTTLIHKTKKFRRFPSPGELSRSWGTWLCRPNACLVESWFIVLKSWKSPLIVSDTGAFTLKCWFRSNN